METGIRIGTEISEDTAKRMVSLIETVFRVGFDTRMEQETIRAALGIVERVGMVGNTSINNCSIVGDTGRIYTWLSKWGGV